MGFIVGKSSPWYRVLALLRHVQEAYELQEPSPSSNTALAPTV